MDPILTSAATLTCPHGGVVQVSAPQSSVVIDGGAVLRTGDIEGARIVGCPSMSPAIKPCTVVVSVASGVSNRVFLDGRPVLLQSLKALTDGTPPGSAMLRVVSPGQFRIPG
jgi:hypothetical protein